MIRLLDIFFLLPHAIDGLLLLLHLIAQYLLRLCVRSLAMVHNTKKTS